MIIACPSCAAKYAVDPTKIGPSGRTVKCAKCGHAWSQAAPTPEELEDAAPAADPAGTPEPAAADQTAAPTAEDLAASISDTGIGDDADIDTDMDFRSSFRDSGQGDAKPAGKAGNGRKANLPAVTGKRGKWPARIAWIVLILVVGGVLGGTVAFQSDITTAWPPSKKLYDTVGLSAEAEKPRLGVRSVKYTYRKADGVNVLRVEGELINLSNVPGDVPNLQVKFLDGAGKTVKNHAFPPPERRMLPGEVVIFRTDVTSPPATAKRIDVGFQEKPAAAR